MQFETLVKRVDEVFERFGLPVYYEKPKFHASFGWAASELNAVTPSDLAVLKELASGESFHVNSIHIKTGNKIHLVHLRG